MAVSAGREGEEEQWDVEEEEEEEEEQEQEQEQEQEDQEPQQELLTQESPGARKGGDALEMQGNVEAQEAVEAQGEVQEEEEEEERKETVVSLDVNREFVIELHKSDDCPERCSHTGGLITDGAGKRGYVVFHGGANGDTYITTPDVIYIADLKADMLTMTWMHVTMPDSTRWGNRSYSSMHAVLPGKEYGDQRDTEPEPSQVSRLFLVGNALIDTDEWCVHGDRLQVQELRVKNTGQHSVQILAIECEPLAGTVLWPPARHAHAATNVGGKIYVFGGRLGEGKTYINDLWRYDIMTSVWERYDTVQDEAAAQTGLGMPGGIADAASGFNSRWPSPRGFASLASTRIDKTDGTTAHVLFLHGGYDGDQLGDMWMFRTDTKQWTCLILPAAVQAAMNLPQTASSQGAHQRTGTLQEEELQQLEQDSQKQQPDPGRRMNHSLFVLRNCIFLYGGRSHKNRMGDVWRYGPIHPCNELPDAGAVFRAFMAARAGAIVPPVQAGREGSACWKLIRRFSGEVDERTAHTAVLIPPIPNPYPPTHFSHSWRVVLFGGYVGRYRWSNELVSLRVREHARTRRIASSAASASASASAADAVGPRGSAFSGNTARPSATAASSLSSSCAPAVASSSWSMSASSTDEGSTANGQVATIQGLSKRERSSAIASANGDNDETGDHVAKRLREADRSLSVAAGTNSSGPLQNLGARQAREAAAAAAAAAGDAPASSTAMVASDRGRYRMVPTQVDDPDRSFALGLVKVLKAQQRAIEALAAPRTR